MLSIDTRKLIPCENLLDNKADSDLNLGFFKRVFREYNDPKHKSKTAQWLQEMCAAMTALNLLC